MGFNAVNKRNLVEASNILRQIIVLRLKTYGIFDARSTNLYDDCTLTAMSNETLELPVLNICVRIYGALR
jgi:hypothetical protein